jgi:urea transporter/murein DD-endopeptidase MepM/ murein hydrolase activator NlpD
MAATFVVPAQGLAGLAGLVLSNLAALAFGMPRKQIRQGYFAYNGLLVGLALGLTFRVNFSFVLVLIVVSILGVFVASAVRAVFERYIGTPPLSVPFVLTTWLAISAGERFSGLFYTLTPYEITALSGVLPHSIEFLVRSLGAALFQLSVPSGILIALGLLLFSRYGFILAVAGLASGSILHMTLGGRPTDLTGEWIGFNFVLTALALGGVWAVPGLGSFLLAMVGAACCAIIAEAAMVILKPLGLPLLAFPFVATTTIILYAVKHRERLDYFQTITLPADSPEDNLKAANNYTARALASEIPGFELPFHGEWTVTQGISGEYTHQGLWTHAWDFEVFGEDGRPFRGDGSKLEDFLDYKLPILSPGAGKVVRVVDHIRDNPVGQVNADSNWGNLVIIWHYGSVYTALCHMAEGEVTVREGAQVQAGDVIGKVGSSGRSPVPHLHFQVQYSPEIGAPTVWSELVNYVVKENGLDRYVTRGVPKKDQRVKWLQTDISRFEAGSFPLGESWKFVISHEGEEHEEIWHSEVDFFGNRYLCCHEAHARIHLVVDRKSLIFLDYKGSRGTALSWFFLALPRIPFTKMNVTWKDKLPPDLLLPWYRKLLFDLAEPLVPLAGLNTVSRFLQSPGAAFTVETVLKPTGALFRGEPTLILTSTFEHHRGLVSLKVTKSGRTVLEIRQSDRENTDMRVEQL